MAEVQLFVSQRLPRTLASVREALRRVLELLADARDAELLQLRSLDENLVATLQLHGASFDADVALAAPSVAANSSNSAAKPRVVLRHSVRGSMPRLASLRGTVERAVASIEQFDQRELSSDCGALLAFLDAVDDDVERARRLQVRTAAVSSSVRAVVDRASELEVAPLPTGGLVFDFGADGCVVALDVGFTDLAIVNNNNGAAAAAAAARASPWRTLRTRLRRHEGGDRQHQLRDQNRAACESGVLREVQSELERASATLSRARSNVCALFAATVV